MPNLCGKLNVIITFYLSWSGFKGSVAAPVVVIVVAVVVSVWSLVAMWPVTKGGVVSMSLLNTRGCAIPRLFCAMMGWLWSKE